MFTMQECCLMIAMSYSSKYKENLAMFHYLKECIDENNIIFMWKAHLLNIMPLAELETLHLQHNGFFLYF